MKVINCRVMTCVTTCRGGGLVALSHHRGVCRMSCQGTLYLDTTWSVQRAKNSNSAKNKLTFELFSDRQGLLVQADSVEESNTWLHYLETLLRRLKRITK